MSFPISSDRTSSSASRAQRPPATRTANEPSWRNTDAENSNVGCQPARHHSATANVASSVTCCSTSAQAPAPRRRCDERNGTRDDEREPEAKLDAAELHLAHEHGLTRRRQRSRSRTSGHPLPRSSRREGRRGNGRPGPPQTAASTEKATPNASDAQKTVDRTTRVALSVCTSAAPMPMSATDGAKERERDRDGGGAVVRGREEASEDRDRHEADALDARLAHKLPNDPYAYRPLQMVGGPPSRFSLDRVMLDRRRWGEIG